MYEVYISYILVCIGRPLHPALLLCTKYRGSERGGEHLSQDQEDETCAKLANPDTNLQLCNQHGMKWTVESY